MTEKLPVERLIDLSVEENILPDRKFHYRWYQLGEWQFDTLIQLGLEPQHDLLDLGCGPMRLGQFAISYLEEGRYFGIDAYPPYIRLGNRILEECGITKQRTVIHSTTFEFEKLGSEFDFAVAQSVFTHLSGEQVYECIGKLKSFMRPGSRLLFTYLIGSRPRGFLYGGVQPMVRLSFPDASWFDALAAKFAIRFERSEIRHPSQRVGILTF